MSTLESPTFHIKEITTRIFLKLFTDIIAFPSRKINILGTNAGFRGTKSVF